MRKLYLAVLSLILVGVVSGLFPRGAYATSPTDSVKEIISTLNCQMIGCPGTTGAVMFFANGIDFMTRTPPASANDFVAYETGRLRFPGTPTPAYAAVGGQGFNSLTPVLAIWTATRNFAYLIFAVIFVVTGLLIIFRVKVDPKTVVTIQSALPKIIWAIVLVTFSYAIAGFMIDIMYVMVGLIITIIQMVGLTDAANMVRDNVQNNGNIFGFFLSPVMIGTIGSASLAVGNVVNNFIGGALGGVAGLMVASLAIWIISIAILWALFKTWFMLVSAYANIILGIIFAPMQLMLDAIPGQNQFETWLRMVLANLLSYPVVIIMMFIGAAVSTNLGQSVTLNSLTNPPSGFIPPLIGGINQIAVQSLIGLGILLTIPKTLEILQQVLKSPQFKWATAWNEAIAKGVVGTQGLGGVAAMPVQYKMGKEYRAWAAGEAAKEKAGMPFATEPSRLSWAGAAKMFGQDKKQ